MMKVKRVLFLMLALVLLTGIIFSAIITAATYPYQDSTLSVEVRVADLLSRMTLEEKAGQMIQTERSLASASDLKTYFLGSILNGGGNVPSPNTPTGWCDMIDAYQTAAMQTRLQIPFIYGSDAVHGHNNVYGATVFPHNIGMGATRDADLVQRMGAITANEVRATGVHWTFAPCIAVPQNEKWGRTYEGYSEDTDLVTQLGVAFVKGVQGASYPADLKRNDKIAACIKHYIGDGATDGGVNEGNVTVSETVIRQKYLPPYTAAINAGAQTVMVSFNKISGVECHASSHYLIDILKNELKFDGLVISDYNGIDDNDSNYRNAVKIAVNAGVDMIMVSNKWRDCLTYIKDLANTGEIPQSRIDDAVSRILRVKFRMGLFENPYVDRSLMPAFGSTEHRAVAREAVRKSLVLLKNNNNILPLAKTGKKIFVAGKCADNIGYQCGGWTISWQGMGGNITTGTTILQGIRNVATRNTITYQQNGTGAAGNDVAIVVIGETPYAETYGDNQTLALDSTDITTLQNVKNSGVPMIVILVSGRPMIVSGNINDWSAFVAAWLPGTECQGIAEVLFGDYNFSGKLPMVWPQSISQVPISPNDGQTPLYPFGAGLTYNAATSPTPTPAITATPTATPGTTVTPTPVRTATPWVTATPTPVRTATPLVTATPAATVTPVATATPVLATGSIKIQFYNQSTAATSNQLYLNIKLLNTGTSAINLSNIKIRYYYTIDGAKSQNFWCDWSPVGSGNVSGTFITMSTPKTGADTYAEIGFSSGAGSLAAGGNTTVQARIAKNDWTNYNQADDYSFNSTATTYADWTKTTGYLSGALQWGTEP
jgi:beta-glucosidase